MHRHPKQQLLPVAAILLLFSGILQGQEKTAEREPAGEDSRTPAAKKAAQFLRIVKDKAKKPKSLETAVTRFVKGDGNDAVTVDLVSAVHIGDKEYYDKLNKLFSTYDVVFYELVAPRGVRPVMGEKRSGNPVSFLQNSMKTTLNLESQTERVNYQKRNFVHADMTPAQIAHKMKERGDTGLTVALDVISDMMRQVNKQQKSGKVPELDLLTLMFDENSDQKLKLMMAEQFVQQGALEDGLGKTLNRMLIADRNEVAMKIFDEEMARKKYRNAAIYYGAAHMPDFQKRLLGKRGYRFKENKWLKAWDLQKTRSAKETPPDPLKALFRVLSEQSKPDR